MLIQQSFPFKQAPSSEQQQQNQQQNIRNHHYKSKLQKVNSEQQSIQALSQYTAYFKDVSPQSTSLNLSQIKVRNDTFFQQLTITDFSHSKNYQIVIFQLRYSIYCFKLKVISVEGQSPHHGCFSIGFGSSARIYGVPKTNKEQYNYKQYAVKCFSLKNTQGYKNTILNIFKQIFLLKLSTQLTKDKDNKPPQFFYFDAIHYSNCIQFAMTYCIWDQNKVQDIEKDLKPMIKNLHENGCVHCDIKIQNIAFNQILNKWVLLDFGLATLIKEKIGQKKIVSFMGTFGYVCPDMCRIYKSKEKGFVDLYYNDYFGLKTVLRHLKQKKYKNEVPKNTLNLVLNNHILQKIQDSQFEMKIKYFLYQFNNNISMQLKIYKKCQHKNYEKLFKIFYQFSKQIVVKKHRFIFQNIIFDENSKQSEEFNDKKKKITMNLILQQKSIQYQEQKHSQYYDHYSQLFQSKIPSKNILLLETTNPEKELRDEEWINNSSQQIYFKYVLEYVRFNGNKWKINISQKIQICKIFQKIIVKRQVITQLSLEQTITYLFDYCICDPLTTWKLQHLQLISTQYFMLGLAQNEKVILLFDKIIQSSLPLAQSALHSLIIYETLIWDQILLIKQQEINYLSVYQKMFYIHQELIKKYKQQNLSYFFARMSQCQKFDNRVDLNKIYVVAVNFIYNFSLSYDCYRHQSDELQNYSWFLDYLLDHQFLVIFGKQIALCFLNLTIRYSGGSEIQKTFNLISLMLDLHNDDRSIRYFHFTIINFLKKVRQLNKLKEIYKQWRQLINYQAIYQNNIITILLKLIIEQLPSKQTLIQSTKIITSSFQSTLFGLIKNKEPFELKFRPIFIFFKFIQISQFIHNFSTLKDFSLIKDFHYHEFSYFSQDINRSINIFTFDYKKRLANQQMKQSFSVIRDILQLVTQNYYFLIENKLIQYISLIGRIMDVNIIINSQIYGLLLQQFCVYDHQEQIQILIGNQQQILFQIFTERLITPISGNQLIRYYYQQYQLFNRDYHKFQQLNHNSDPKLVKEFLLKLDFLISSFFFKIQGKVCPLCINFNLLKIILTINISYLHIIRSYRFKKEFLSSSKVKKLLQDRTVCIKFKKEQLKRLNIQVLSLYIEYISNLLRTYQFFIQTVQTQNSQQQCKNLILQFYKNNIQSVKFILSERKLVRLLILYKCQNNHYLMFLKLILIEICQQPKKQQRNVKLIEFIVSMALFLEGSSTNSFFIQLKGLFQITYFFDFTNLLEIANILLSIDWKSALSTINLIIPKFAYFSIMFHSSLIDAIITKDNNKDNLQKGWVYVFSKFQCKLIINPVVILLLAKQKRLQELINFKDKLKILPFILLVSLLHKASIIKYSRQRHLLALLKKYIKFQLLNWYQNIQITYCEQFIKLSRQNYSYFMKALSKRMNIQNLNQNINIELLLAKIKYYHHQ